MRNFKCADACEYGDKLWTIESSGWYIYAMNTLSWTIELISLVNSHFPIYYRKILTRENSLFFVRNTGIGIYKYNIESGHENIYDMDLLDEIIVMNAFFYEDEIIIVPLYIYDCLYSFDIKTYKFQKIHCPLNIKNRTEDKFIPSAHLINNKIWFITNSGSELQSYDLKQKTVDTYSLPEGINVGSFCEYNDNLLLASKFGYQVYTWTREEGITDKFIYEGEFEKSDIYPQIVTCGEKIYLLSVMSNGIYKIDEKDSKVKQIHIVNSDKNVEGKALFIECVKTKNRIVILPWRANELIVINSETDGVEEYEISIDEFALKFGLSQEKRHVIYESHKTEKKSLMKEICKEIDLNKKMLSSEVGEEIFCLIKSICDRENKNEKEDNRRSFK
ncbi:MAG: hypothetical protein HFG89_04020 [Dorea sp.]|jgi:hypothetical protein|nr:hypothetical protein [Dorea sp.]